MSKQDSERYIGEYNPELIDGDFEGKHIISVEQFSRNDLNIIFEETDILRLRTKESDRGLSEIASGKVMATLFFESSTRTDLSFQAAMVRLGGEVIGASNGVQFSSVYKGENLADTVRAAGCYADIIVLRHQNSGSSYEASYYLDKLGEKLDRKPVLISGGDGVGEHPTQALLDAYTIHNLKGGFEGLNITLVGDLKNGRTVHSLSKLIGLCNGHGSTNLNFVSPESLKMPQEITRRLPLSVTFRETEDLTEVLESSDVIYWTRIQEERFDNKADYEAIKDSFVMTPQILAQANEHAILMHPLPRKNEMGTQSDHDILDADPRAVYFQQMENGMFVRMALVKKVLGK